METEILPNVHTHVREDCVSEKRMTVPVLVLALYILIEYGRPQFLAPIKPGLLVQGLLILCLLPHFAEVRKVLSDKYFKLYLMLLFLMTLHVYIAPNNYYAFLGLKVMVSYLVIAVSCVVFLDNLSKLNFFLFVFILVMMLCAVNRISGVNFLGISGGSVFFDENDFALSMNVALPIAFFLGFTQKGWKRWFFWMAVIAFVLGNMVTGSRGGFVGLVAVGAVCWWSMKYRLRAIPVFILLAILAWSFASPSTKQEIMEIGLDSAEKDTGRDRIELWKVGWRAYVDNPVLGVGQGNMPIVMNKYRFDNWGESFWKRDMWGRMTHSIYFTLLPELGTVGVIIFWFLLKDLYRKTRDIKDSCARMTNREKVVSIENINRALLVSLFGFLITGVFLSVLYYPPFWNISGLLVAMSLISSRMAGKPEIAGGAIAFSRLSQAAHSKDH